jgi:16S rRNA (guanine966-N2)-methyltransferase
MNMGTPSRRNAKPQDAGRRAKNKGPLPREIRIIGGLWKRSKLPVPDRPGLRPTPDRVRETLFNWLSQHLAGARCIDVFAGTGALGFEAASRGAAQVLLVERDEQLVSQLNTTKQRLDAQAVAVERGDGIQRLQRCAAASMDIVFLDPPFDSGLFEAALKAAAPVLAPGGHLYLEAPRAWTGAEAAALGLQVHKYLKAGAVHAHLLCPA